MGNDEYCSVAMDANGNAVAIGILRKTPNGKDYCAYLGIPYAEPPVGVLRFEVI